MRRAEPEQPLQANAIQPAKQRMASGAPARIDALIKQLSTHFRHEPKGLSPHQRALEFIYAFQRQRVLAFPDAASIELYNRRTKIAAGWAKNASNLTARREIAQFYDESIKTAGGIARAQRQREQRAAERCKSRRGK